MPDQPAPDECANCGAAIPPKAKACPGCGADERTGWRENDATRYDGLDLPDSAFADEADTGGGGSARANHRSTPRRGLRWYWLAVAALLIASLVLGVVSFR